MLELGVSCGELTKKRPTLTRAETEGERAIWAAKKKRAYKLARSRRVGEKVAREGARVGQNSCWLCVACMH